MGKNSRSSGIRAGIFFSLRKNFAHSMEQSLLSDVVEQNRQERVRVGLEKLEKTYGKSVLPRQAVFQASDGGRWVGTLQTNGTYALSHR